MPRKGSPYKDHPVSLDDETFNLLKKYCSANKVPMKRIAEAGIKMILGHLDKDKIEVVQEKKTVIRKKRKDNKDSPHDTES